jgi:hypothetical protein
VGAVRSPEIRLQARKRRLAALLESGQVDRVTKAIAALHAGGNAPSVIRVRSQFVHTETPAAPGDAQSPVASRLRSPRGQALRLYLLAIFVAQCVEPPGARVVTTNRPLVRTGDDTTPGWTDLFTAPVYGPPPGKMTKERTGPRAKVERQLKSGLDRLEEAGLVELGPARSKTRYDGFALMAETGRGELAEPAYYTIPVGVNVVLIPAEFFTRGWLWALSDSEIACYLMFRHLAREYPLAHQSTGVFVYGQVREEHYGLPRDAYEAHILL